MVIEFLINTWFDVKFFVIDPVLDFVSNTWIDAQMFGHNSIINSVHLWPLPFFYFFAYTGLAPSTCLMFAAKLMLCLTFLILIRGGVPRYRYDFLTKLGWVKFLGYVLTVFIITGVTVFLW